MRSGEIGPGKAGGLRRLALNSLTRGTPVRQQLDTAIRVRRTLADSRTV